MHKSHVWEKSSSWDLSQNAVSQSDYRILKSTISLEQNDEKAWLFACWYRFMEIRSWLKNIGVGLVKNGCGHSILKTPKLAVYQREMNGIYWFLVCWYKFRKAKSYFNNFLVLVVKNGRSLLGLGTLKSAVSQELIKLTIKPNNFKRFYSQISEKHDQTFIFAEGAL